MGFYLYLYLCLLVLDLPDIQYVSEIDATQQKALPQSFLVCVTTERGPCDSH